MTDDQLQKRAEEVRDTLFTAALKRTNLLVPRHPEDVSILAKALLDAYRQGIEDAAGVADKHARRADDARDGETGRATSAGFAWAHVEAQAIAAAIRKLAGEEQKGKA